MNNFFAYVNRMKYIERWSLMYSSNKENLMEHTAQAAIIAHALATINNVVYSGDVDADKITSKALFHDASEVITGDLPTPVKYYNSEIKTAYKDLEHTANAKLISMLPDELKSPYNELLNYDTATYEAKLLKAADKLSAYIKCLEELNFGNKEFSKAKITIEQDLKKMGLNEVDYFMENFVPSFKKTLDELD